MTRCSIINCSNTTNKVGAVNRGISFHCFKNDPQIKNKWIEATGHKKWFPTKYSRTCSIHFHEDTFNGPSKYRRVISTAYPTIDVVMTINDEKDSHCGSGEMTNAIVDAVQASFTSVHGAMQVLTALNLAGSLWPAPATVADGDSFDFIIVGAGTAGNVLANRLTEDGNYTVLVIEAGGNPSLESVLAGLFPYQPFTYQDWNITSQTNDTFGQNLKNKVIALTSGFMLGGSSSLDHMLHVRGNKADYDQWATAANDPSWNWEGLLPYFKKAESVLDEEVLTSETGRYHGTRGNVLVTRQLYNETQQYLQAFEELGYKLIVDSNAKDTLGYFEPLYTIAGGLRQSSAKAYLTPAKDRSNLYVVTDTLVTRVVFTNGEAVGVKAFTSAGEIITLTANREVILSAGTFNSAKLLMLSGVGPAKHLESMGIPLMSDLPVGQNLQDHVSVPIVYKMAESTANAAALNPTKFPIPTFIGYVALEQAQTYPDYQAIGLLFPHDSLNLVGVCSNVFAYDDAICQTMYEASAGRNILYVVHNIMHPKSRGHMLLASTDPSDQPLVYMNMFSEVEDLQNEAKYLEHFHAIINSTFFQSVGAELMDLKLSQCSNYTLGSSDYWTCYTRHTGNTMYHYSSTCSMGSVVDSRLRVKGVTRLRVADASVMPTTTSGNIKEPITALAEKLADMIREDHAIS